MAGIFALEPGLASAYAILGYVDDFAYGFSHSLGGLGHVLTKVIVGLFVSQLGGSFRCLVSAASVSTMVFDGAFELASIAVSFVELGIGPSIFVFGGFVAFNLRASVASAMALVGFFAVFHGYAHGAEMPETANGLAYGGGFVLTTVTLHALGPGFGLLLDAGAGR